MKNKKRLVLIDGHSLLYRAYHAYPPLTTSKGELVNAVYGFTSILLNVIAELEPTHLVVTFDRDKPTFRHTEYVGYKAQREEMPTELADQQERVEEVTRVLNIPIFAVQGYEADDVIGTLAEQAKVPQITHSTSSGQANAKLQMPNKKNANSWELDEVVINTGDMDALQLVESEGRVKVRIYVPGRGKRPATMYDERAVEKKYNGLEPEQVIDLKGLAGDASDNIPGVKGIGAKTASKLLLEFKTVEGVYKNIDKVRDKFSERIANLLVDAHEDAMLSKKLATIVKDVPIELVLKECVIHDYDKSEAIKLFQELEFKSLIKKLPNDDFEQMVQEAMF